MHVLLYVPICLHIIVYRVKISESELLYTCISQSFLLLNRETALKGKPVTAKLYIKHLTYKRLIKYDFFNQDVIRNYLRVSTL